MRIQHRGGRLWIFNSRALELLRPGADDPLERVDGQLTGRLYDNDRWLRQRLGRQRPDLTAVSRYLASLGVIALTDTSPNNSLEELHWLRQAQQGGELLQDVLLMGDASLDAVAELHPGTAECPGLAVGPHKFHLHEARLPDYQAVHEAVVSSHRAGRNVAFHCVSRTELAFAIGILRDAAVLPGDRIEHASVTPPEWLDEMAALGLAVVTQPGFVAERGEAYLEQVEAADQPWLYRLRGFLDAAIPLAGSTDAPFGDANPWRAMQAAVTRLTAGGRPLGPDEALAPEQALALFHSPLATPGRNPPRVEVGAVADLCLLRQPWAGLRHDLASARVRLSLRAGQPVWRG